MKATHTRGFLRYLRKNFDSAAIVSALAAIGLDKGDSALNEEQLAVLAALKRSSSSLENASLEQIQEYLRGLDADQVPGVISNTKGILHEMEFVRLENEDGDSVYASYFEATNHPDTDVQLIDRSTGESWEVQLKATDNSGYAQEWMDTHPDGEILVTEELADKMDLPTSGLSNDTLTTNVETFVDKMIDAGEDADIWNYFPALSVATISFAIWELWNRHTAGEIDIETFKSLSARATGIKLAKVAAFGVLLSIPVIGQITGVALVAQLLIGLRKSF
jgi:hypothetical protein